MFGLGYFVLLVGLLVCSTVWGFFLFVLVLSLGLFLVLFCRVFFCHLHKCMLLISKVLSYDTFLLCCFVFFFIFPGRVGLLLLACSGV